MESGWTKFMEKVTQDTDPFSPQFTEVGRDKTSVSVEHLAGKDAKAFIRALKKCWFESPEKLRKHEKYLRRYRNRAQKSQ